jgi:hypothetical protein
MPSPIDVGGGTITTDSMLAANSSRTPSTASGVAGGAKPPAPSS